MCRIINKLSFNVAGLWHDRPEICLKIAVVCINFYVKLKAKADPFFSTTKREKKDGKRNSHGKSKTQRHNTSTEINFSNWCPCVPFPSSNHHTLSLRFFFVVALFHSASKSNEKSEIDSSMI